MLRSHYELLELAPDADAAVIEGAYLELSRILHPDRPNGPSALLGMVTEAYEALRNPKRRAGCDQSLAGGTNPPRTAPPSTPHPGPQSGPADHGVRTYGTDKVKATSTCIGSFGTEGQLNGGFEYPNG
jgi:curved DNA-binding protein CbpA